jgi:PLP dependent protein
MLLANGLQSTLCASIFLHACRYTVVMNPSTPELAISENLQRLRTAIARAAERAGRRAGEVQLIAVSKTQPLEAVAAAIAAGQRLFGENAVQEALLKIQAFPELGLEWHFIGHLQSNKAKSVPGSFSWLHSLDSLKLASRLSRLAQDKQATVKALIEVNMTRDPGKHGIAPEQLAPLLDQLLAEDLHGIRLRGLMTLGPHPATSDELRATFAGLRQLRDDCAQRFALPDFTELSMGMSGDFVEAILEGSTFVRLGTAVFGHRTYGAEH